MQLKDGRIGDRRHRPWTIKERTLVGTTYVDVALDLGIFDVALHYKSPGATVWTTILASTNDQLEIFDAPNGIIKFKPDRDFFDEVGDWYFEVEVLDDPELAAPSTDIMVIRIKDGAA